MSRGEVVQRWLRGSLGPIFQFLIFLSGCSLGLLAWDHISLPFQNNVHVVGYCSQIAFNPSNDRLRFIVFLFLPILLWASLFFFSSWSRSYPKSAFLAEEEIPGAARPGASGEWLWPALIACLLALSIPTYHAFGRFDPYHEGETLGPALCLVHGETPYHDFFFYHGLIQDPFRTFWALRLGIDGIAGERTFESLAKVILWILMGVFFYRWFNRSLLWSLGSLSFIAFVSAGFSFAVLNAFFFSWTDPNWFADVFYHHLRFWQSFDWFILPSRDVCTMAFLLAYSFLRSRKKEDLSGGWDWGWFVLFLVAALSLAYSVDRGVFLMLMALWVLLVAGVCRELRAGSWLSMGAGLTVGGVFVSFLLKWDWADFIRFTFFQMPRYKELSEKLPYEINLPLFLVVLVPMAWFFYRNATGVVMSCARNGAAGFRRCVEFNRDEMTFLLMSLLYFQNVLERSDKEHVAYSLFPLYCLVLTWLWRRRIGLDGLLRRWIPSLKKTAWVFVVLISGLALSRDFRGGILEYDFPIGRSDLSFLSPEEQDFVQRFKPLLKPGDGFFNMTSEAAWYYLLGQDCPTRYPYLGIAATEEGQKEEITDLVQKKVKWVLYRDGDLSYQMDGIPNDRKFPFLNAYIQARYRPYGTIDGYEIWVLKAPDPLSS